MAYHGYEDIKEENGKDLKQHISDTLERVVNVLNKPLTSGDPAARGIKDLDHYVRDYVSGHTTSDQNNFNMNHGLKEIFFIEGCGCDVTYDKGGEGGKVEKFGGKLIPHRTNVLENQSGANLMHYVMRTFCGDFGCTLDSFGIIKYFDVPDDRCMYPLDMLIQTMVVEGVNAPGWIEAGEEFMRKGIKHYHPNIKGVDGTKTVYQYLWEDGRHGWINYGITCEEPEYKIESIGEDISSESAEANL